MENRKVYLDKHTNLLQLEESPRTEGGAAAGGPGSSAGPLPPSEETAEPEARLVSNTTFCPLRLLVPAALAPLASAWLLLPGWFSASWSWYGWEIQG